MLETILYRVFATQWQMLLVVTVTFVVAAEIGFRIGLRLHRENDQPRKAQIGGVQGAILGLLALLLGFTFAMAVGRYESRRQLVLDEANAIGTTYLRAALLPEAHQADVEALLRQYVDARLDFYDAGADRGQQDAAEKTTAELQRELWAHAVAAGKDAPTPLATTFITALNETIDLDAARVNALRTHVPVAVWLLVLIVAAVGCYACGYAAGASGARSTFANLILPLLIAVVITLIGDLDRARGGLIDIKQQPLIDLKESLGAGGDSAAVNRP